MLTGDNIKVHLDHPPRYPVTTGILKHVRLCIFQTTLSFLAAETRPEGLREKWHRVCVLLSASLKTFGFCTLEVTLGCCQRCLMAEDSADGCKEVSHQSSSDSSLFPLPLLILGTGLMTPPGTQPQGIEPPVFSVKMNEKCLLGHIKLSKEQSGLPARGIIVKKAEILRKRDYESPVIFTVQIPSPYISTWFLLLSRAIISRNTQQSPWYVNKPSPKCLTELMDTLHPGHATCSKQGG